MEVTYVVSPNSFGCCCFTPNSNIRTHTHMKGRKCVWERECVRECVCERERKKDRKKIIKGIWKREKIKNNNNSEEGKFNKDSGREQKQKSKQEER